ncbi:hypothetical protein BUALT_Bualt18G0080400 [Buddleja alternifolia]|uniref:Uncharacterized protein n=1 Tax=Buddleja alternifolia TaxID=168488 RepID=A0AAV6WCY2_9LAMI|nr:hypothetical protein BUALT_Bualt18G0080400 [Buddleja alternifolia]
MLSTENPPPDLPCSSQILKSNIVSDDDNQVVVDLFNSGLDDKIPLPNFSIRDYVFNRRGKDIKTHWPFSAKNLQLCLKHGVKDVLPPFHTLDFLRNPSTVKCAVESISDSHVKLSRLSDDHNLPVSSNDVGQNLALSEPEEDKEYPSTATNQSCSSLNSVPLIKSRYLESEAENSSKKIENSIQNPVKKCKLIVKLSNIVETKSKEEAPLNTSIVSETMASKVCPVCKTFSSSSNTTLNAHIDQCLSGESTAKLTTDSKVVKHRIKPRKTKLMVDIYETALRCTLEDLDRRNGTNWASNLGFPPRDLVEEKDKTFSSEDKNKESAVYVDSNGTKLRILSKFSDTLSISSAKDDCGRRKLVEREKESKFISSKKKKYLVQKHNLLNRPYGQRSCSPMSDHRPEFSVELEKDYFKKAYQLYVHACLMHV